MKKLLLFFVLALATSANAQTQKPKSSAPAEPAIPKVTVSIGGYKGGNITSDILSGIVDSSVTVRDGKGTTYQVVRFRVLYKFKSTYDDPDTGQKKAFDDMRTNDFSNTAVMSELWRQSIKDNVKKGDEMIFDNIIVKLKNGTRLMAPPVTFKVI
ncbi:MAG: hypothetical protein KF862_26890 [Chitinophagaceae bacterium]|nr:hypothetical protein [Chitinophagaceae bacterium]